MHDTIVKMKDGRQFCGPIWMFRPREGWFSVIDSEHDEVPIAFADVEEAYTDGERITISHIGRMDELARARHQGWDGVTRPPPEVFEDRDGE